MFWLLLLLMTDFPFPVGQSFTQLVLLPKTEPKNKLLMFLVQQLLKVMQNEKSGIG